MLRRATAALLLLLPVVAMLAVPLYDRRQPELAGVPFFYWFQLAWAPATVLLLAVAARVLRRPGRSAQAGPFRPGGSP